MRPWVLIMIVLRIFSAHAFCARKASVWKGKRHGLIDWHYPSSYSRPIISSRKRFAIVSGSSDPNDDSVPVDRDEEEEETSHVPTPPNTPPFVEAQLLQDVDQAYYMVHLYEQEVEMLREKLGYMQDELLDEQNEFRIQKKTWTETLETFSQELSKRDAELNALHALLKEQRSNNDNTIANDSNEENQEPENDNGSTAAATVKGVDSEQNMQVPPPKPDSSLPLKPKRFANFKKFGLLKKERPKLNKATIAKMGTSVVLSYSFVSNIFAISSMSIAWYIFSRKTGLSPLSPGQWPSFLAVYTGFFAFLNIIRPARFALSVALAKYFDRLLQLIQNRFNRSRAFATTVIFSLNFILNWVYFFMGVGLASLFSGVPLFAGRSFFR